MNADVLISKLAKLADKLDGDNFHSAADAVDIAIEKLAAQTHVDADGMLWNMVGPASFPVGFITWQNSKGQVQKLHPDSKPEPKGAAGLDIHPRQGLKKEEPEVLEPEAVESKVPSSDPNMIVEWMNKNVIEPNFGDITNKSDDQKKNLSFDVDGDASGHKSSVTMVTETPDGQSKIQEIDGQNPGDIEKIVEQTLSKLQSMGMSYEVIGSDTSGPNYTAKIRGVKDGTTITLDLLSNQPLTGYLPGLDFSSLSF